MLGFMGRFGLGGFGLGSEGMGLGSEGFKSGDWGRGGQRISGGWGRRSWSWGRRIGVGVSHWGGWEAGIGIKEVGVKGLAKKVGIRGVWFGG